VGAAAESEAAAAARDFSSEDMEPMLVLFHRLALL